MPDSNPPFVYRSSFESWDSQHCGMCRTPLTSGLYIFGIATLEVERHCAYICDDCLLKLFNAVPLLSWAMRETILREAVGDLASAG